MKPLLSIIVAIARNRAIGKNLQLLWHLPNDLKYFKKQTQGHTVVMGHNTYLSLPRQKALPNRRNIIISDILEQAPEGFELACSIPEAMKMVENDEKVFIMGGGMIYEQFLPLVDRLYLTRVEKDFEADTYFPIVDFEKWELIDINVVDDDPDADFEYRFEVWERKK